MKAFNFSGIQELGRALMLPIAVLPAAALLLRFGQADLFDLPFMANAGAAIFDNLGILFAVGIAVGFAKENNGAAGLAGVLGYFVIIKGAAVMLDIPPELADNTARASFLANEASRMSIPVGIISGLTAGLLYNRFHTIRLPDYLSFFGGKRFVPIIAGFVCLGWALFFGKAWPVLSDGLDGFSGFLSASGDAGLFLYGVLNRLLIITGLHHILNNVVWFLHGSFSLVQDGASLVITGDLNRFSRGDPAAGAFMSGFFPVMMFGLPAACLAMYRNAFSANKRAVGGMLLSMALTAFLTGITEPIEFAFIFLAPALYVVHAILTGISMVIMNGLNIKLGFGFSAGFIDYVINFNKSTNPLVLLPVGCAYFALYYFLFSFCIQKFGLPTVGRERKTEPPTGNGHIFSPTPDAACRQGTSPHNDVLLQAIGGVSNVISISAKMTRLVLELKNTKDAVDLHALKKCGAFGFSRPEANLLEIIFGSSASFICTSLQQSLAACNQGSTDASKTRLLNNKDGTDKARSMILALGGPKNLVAVDACATRLRLKVRNTGCIDDAELKRLGAHGLVRPDAGSIQVVLGPVADTVSSDIREALRTWEGDGKSPS